MTMRLSSLKTLALPVLFAVAMLAGCGGGSDNDPSGPIPAPAPATPAPPTPPPPPPPATATIGPAGGTVTAGTIALQIPAGALAAPVEITLTPQATADGDTVTFAVSPQGQSLRQPALLRHTGAVPAGQSFYWFIDGQRRFLPSKREGDSLTATIRSLGELVSEMPAAPMRTADPVRPMNAGGGSGRGGVAVLDCEQKITQMGAVLRQTLNRATFEAAATLFEELEAIKLQCQQEKIRQLQTEACKVFTEAVAAAGPKIDGELSFRRAVISVINAKGAVDLLDAPCDTSAVAGLLTAKFDELLQFLEVQFARPTPFDPIGRRTLRSILRYQADCEMTGVAECERFGKQLYPFVLDRARATAFQLCVANRSSLDPALLYELGRGTIGKSTDPFMEHARFTYGDLERDIHRCVPSTLVVRSLDEAVGDPDEIARKEIVGGGAPGNIQMETTIEGRREGAITIGGDIPLPMCADGNLLVGDQLVARIDGRVLTQAAANPARATWTLNTQPIDFVPERDLPRLGLDPAAKQVTIELFREGNSCVGYAQQILLYRVRIDMGGPSKIAIFAGEAVVTVTSDGTGLRRAILQFASEVSWSPTQDRMALTNQTGIVLVKDDFTGERMLLARSAADVDAERFFSTPAWSSDGKRVHFLVRTGTRLTPKAVDVATGAVTELGPSFEAPFTFAIAWSPDRSKLAYDTLIAESGGIVVRDLSTGSTRTVTSPAQGSVDAFPAWAPDGKQLAYVRQRYELGTPEDPGQWIGAVRVINLETGASRAVSGDYREFVAWSPDGSELAWGARNRSFSVSWTEVVNLSSGVTRLVANGAYGRIAWGQ